MPQPNTSTENAVIKTLFKHNTWANLKLLNFCETLTDAQLDSSGVGTYGTIRNTLKHLIEAEVSYVYRVNATHPAEPMPREGFPPFSLLKDWATWASDALVPLAYTAHDDTLVEERWETTVERYPLASLMLQSLNHSTEHRTQISTIITQLGVEPPDMTGWGYMVETGEYQETKTAP